MFWVCARAFLVFVRSSCSTKYVASSISGTALIEFVFARFCARRFAWRVRSFFVVCLPRWNKRYGCQLSVSDPNLLRLSHISLLVMDKERGPKAKGELLGVANLSLAEVLW